MDCEISQGVQHMGIHDQIGNGAASEVNAVVSGSSRIIGDDHYGDCAICLNKILLQETAIIKSCEHAYCVTCILRWASCKKEPTCPQCKVPFEFLNVHRTLDGSIRDFMFEEGVCLLLRASWFIPLVVAEQEAEQEEVEYDLEDYYYEEDDDEDLDDLYLTSSSNLRIGNRRWGDSGFVRSGRQEARPIYSSSILNSGAGSSRERKKKESAPKEIVGRRAKRALKREAADKADAEKHQQRLARMGRK